MNRILDGSLIRDASIFVGAAAGVYALKSLQKPVHHEVLDRFPRIGTSAFVPTVVALANLQQPVLMNDVLAAIDRFLLLADERNVLAHGFTINRMASEIPLKVRALIRTAQRSTNSEIAIKAMDFERDEFLQMEAICDNTVRNALLDAQSYT